MSSRLKLSLFLFLIGGLTLYAVLFQVRPWRTYQASEVLGESSGLELFIEPDDGKTPLLNYINNSHRILLEMYLLSDTDIINAFTGRDTRLLLEEHPFGGNTLNQKTKNRLGSSVNWTNPTFTLTHQKSLIFDDKIVCILNMNLTKTAFTKNREYNICSWEKADIYEAENIFNADAQRRDYFPSAPHLVVSPDNSRGKLKALINSAQNQIDIEMEVITDKKIADLLSEKARALPVRILVPDKKLVDNPLVPNAQTRVLKSPYPHAKLIIIDGQRAYIGSINLSLQSLDQNRELGILVSQPNILQRLNDTFTKDWNHASF